MSVKVEEGETAGAPNPSVLDDDADDPVVAEYDVFVSQQLSDHCHIFQYPLRPSERRYEANTVKLSISAGVPSATSKTEDTAASPTRGPGSGVLKTEYGEPGGAGEVEEDAKISSTARLFMELSVQTYGSSRFDVLAANDRGYNAGVLAVKQQHTGKDAKKEEDAAESEMNEQEGPSYRYALQSSPFVPKGSYAVGVLQHGELHLTPVSSIQQFIPAVTAPVHGNLGLGASNPATDPRFVSSIPGGSASSSMQHHLQRQLQKTRSATLRKDSETRRPVAFYQEDSVDSRAIAQRLLCSTLTTSRASTSGGAATRGLSSKPGQPPKGDADGSLDDVYFPLDTTPDPTAKIRKSILLRCAERYRLEDQVKDILASAHVVLLSTLMQLVKPPIDSAPGAQVTEAQVVAILQRFAVCIHGAWVVSSVSQFVGNAAVVREYVLLQFAKSSDATVSRNSLLEAMPNNPALARIIKDVLPTIAVLEKDARQQDCKAVQYPHERLWKLKNLDPVTGGEEPSRVIAFYNELFPAELRTQKANWVRRAEDIEANLEAVKQGRTITARYLRLPLGAASSSAMSGTAGGDAGGAGAGSPLGGRTSAAAAKSSEAREQQIHQARQYLRTLFAHYGVINREVAKERLKELIRQRGSPLYGFPVDCLQGALQQEVTTGVAEGTWILKLIDPVTDQYRKHIVAVMREMPTFVAKDLGEKANQLFVKDALEAGQENPPGIPASIVSKVIAELAEFKQGEKLWHRKNGLVQFHSGVASSGLGGAN